MTVEEAYLLINNLDHEAEFRYTAPQWSTVVVNEHGTILGVIRHHGEPTVDLGRQHLILYPGTVQFTAWPGKFPSAEVLVREVELSRRKARRCELGATCIK